MRELADFSIAIIASLPFLPGGIREINKFSETVPSRGSLRGSFCETGGMNKVKTVGRDIDVKIYIDPFAEFPSAILSR